MPDPVRSGIVPAMDAKPGTIRVVLADDHEALRADTRALLERQPDIAILAEAADGQTAIELTERLQPDVVVMDVTMPVLDGLEATRYIHSHTPGTHVLILSCHDEPEVVEAGRRAGASGYLSKTARSRDLIEAVRAVGGGQSLWE